MGWSKSVGTSMGRDYNFYGLCRCRGGGCDMSVGMVAWGVGAGDENEGRRKMGFAQNGVCLFSMISGSAKQEVNKMGLVCFP